MRKLSDYFCRCYFRGCATTRGEITSRRRRWLKKCAYVDNPHVLSCLHIGYRDYAGNEADHYSQRISEERRAARLGAARNGGLNDTNYGRPRARAEWIVFVLFRGKAS